MCIKQRLICEIRRWNVIMGYKEFFSNSTEMNITWTFEQKISNIHTFISYERSAKYLFTNIKYSLSSLRKKFWDFIRNLWKFVYDKRKFPEKCLSNVYLLLIRRCFFSENHNYFFSVIFCYWKCRLLLEENGTNS